ncbi:MAG: sugar phosphate isomerase/epimerase family protein [Planctomycetota bacterium]|nr:sugar phosphate isomerase/epimerase family protein [Planctomycetota bacterium]
MRQTIMAAGLAGLLGSVSPAAADSAPERNVRKAVKIEMVADGDSLEEKFRQLVELGFDGVELPSPNGWSVEEVVEARDATGLPIHGVVCSEHWSSPLNHPDEAVRKRCIEAIEVAVADAKAYGASSVLVVPAVVNKGMSYEDAWRLSRESLLEVVPVAEAAGIDILFENVWNNFLLSPREAAAYVDSFESECVGWYFDVGNIVAYGWPEQWVRVLGPRLRKVDVKEYSRKKLNDEGRWAGFGVDLLEGDCDWPAVMTALDEIGYSGWMTAEIKGGDRAWLADVAERMDRISAAGGEGTE